MQTIHKLEKVWMAPELFPVELYLSDFDYSHDHSENAKKLYDSLDNIEKILGNSPSIHDIENCLTATWRVISKRVNKLNALYKFKKIPYGHKDIWESLQKYSIAKTTFSNKLKKLRDLIEHSDLKRLPSTKECQELAEYAWYFLRSTDRYVNRVPCEFDLADEPFPLAIKCGPKYDWKFYLFGWASEQQISRVPKENFISAIVPEVEKNERPSIWPLPKNLLIDYSGIYKIKPDMSVKWYGFTVQFDPTKEYFDLLIKRYFEED